MIAKNSLIVLLISCFLVTLVNTAITVSATNLVCDGTTGWEITKDNSEDANFIDFDEASQIYNPTNGDSVPLFMKKGDASSNYKFIYVDNTLKRHRQECTSTAGLKFVGLLR